MVNALPSPLRILIIPRQASRSIGTPGTGAPWEVVRPAVTAEEIYRPGWFSRVFCSHLNPSTDFFNRSEDHEV